MNDKETDFIVDAFYKIKEWHKKLSKATKKDTGMFAFVSDIKGKQNYGILEGDKEGMTYALYQAMLCNDTFFESAKEALEITIDFKKTSEEGRRQREKIKNKKKLLS